MGRCHWISFATNSDNSFGQVIFLSVICQSCLFFGVASICTKICCAGCLYSNFYPLDFNSYRCKTFLQRSDNSCEALRSIAVTPYVPICQGRAFPTMIFFQFSLELSSQWRLYWQCQHATLFYPSTSAFTCEWVRECERLWKAVGHPGWRWHCDAEWSPPIFSANSPKDINVGTSSFQGAPSSIDKMHWFLDILSRNTRDFTHRTCRAVKQFPCQTTGTVSPSWLHVSIVYQCSMHVVTTASHVEQYFLNTQWISSLMRSLWEQIWLGTIWLWEHFWFLSQPLRSGGNRQILGGCWRGLNIRPSIKCRPPFL